MNCFEQRWTTNPTRTDGIGVVMQMNERSNANLDAIARCGVSTTNSKWKDPKDDFNRRTNDHDTYCKHPCTDSNTRVESSANERSETDQATLWGCQRCEEFITWFLNRFKKAISLIFGLALIFLTASSPCQWALKQSRQLCVLFPPRSKRNSPSTHFINDPDDRRTSSIIFIFLYPITQSCSEVDSFKRERDVERSMDTFHLRWCFAFLDRLHHRRMRSIVSIGNLLDWDVQVRSTTRKRCSVTTNSQSHCSTIYLWGLSDEFRVWCGRWVGQVGSGFSLDRWTREEERRWETTNSIISW